MRLTDEAKRTTPYHASPATYAERNNISEAGQPSPKTLSTLPVRRRPAARAEYRPYAGPLSAESPQRYAGVNRLAWRRRHGRALVLVLASFWLGLLWAAAIKPFNAPDEVAHLQAVMQVRKQHILPEIRFEKYTDDATPIGNPGDQAVRDYSTTFGRGGFLNMAYESTQPPLYYVTAGLITHVVTPDPPVVLYLSRLVSALFGAGTVFFCWAATRQFAPRSPVWAVAVAAVVALLPQFCFNSATAANDTSVLFAGAASYYIWFRGLRDPAYDRWMLKAGAIVGLGILAKLSAAVLFPGLALVVFFRAFQVAKGDAKPKWRLRLERGLRMAVGAAVGTLAVCGWYLVRNMMVYGEPSGMADSMRLYKAGFPKVDFEDPIAFGKFWLSTWRSAWGTFGWMDTPLPTELYDQAAVLTTALVGLSALAVLFTLIKWAYRFAKRRPVPSHHWQAVLVMIAVTAGLLYSYITFSRDIADQAQGRYLFLLLLPAGLLFTGGLHAIAPWRRLKALLLSVPIIWLAYLNAVGLLLVTR